MLLLAFHALTLIISNHKLVRPDLIRGSLGLCTMLEYLLRRTMTMMFTLAATSVLIFIIIQLPPGDYLSTYIAELQSQGEMVDEEKIEFLRHQYGLDDSMPVQYFTWVLACCRGTWATRLNTTYQSAKWSGIGCSCP